MLQTAVSESVSPPGPCYETQDGDGGVCAMAVRSKPARSTGCLTEGGRQTKQWQLASQSARSRADHYRRELMRAEVERQEGREWGRRGQEAATVTAAAPALGVAPTATATTTSAPAAVAVPQVPVAPEAPVAPASARQPGAATVVESEAEVRPAHEIEAEIARLRAQLSALSPQAANKAGSRLTRATKAASGRVDLLLDGSGSSDATLSEDSRDSSDDAPSDGDSDHERLCVVCFDEPRSHAFVECMHRCVCEGCAEAILAKDPWRGTVHAEGASCPLCRINSTAIRRVWG